MSGAELRRPGGEDAVATLPPSFRLSELALIAGLTLHGEDVVVTGICADSRRVRPGDLFVAVPGANHDGLQHATDALRDGAAAVCAVVPATGAPTLVASSPRAALADLATIFLDHPTRHISLVGVTGSLGKTSTALLTQAALEGGSIRTGVIGSLGVRARGTVHDTGMTTPDALTLQRELRWMADQGVDYAVMEVSSHGLLLERVRGIELAIGIFTNIVADEHLEFHPTPEHYIRTKLRFLELLRDGAPLVFNADDPIIAAAVSERRPVAAIGVTSTGNESAAVQVRDARASVHGGHFRLAIMQPLRTLAGSTIPPGEHQLHVPILGRQQVDNAAMAATAALLTGVPITDVARGLANVGPIRRRMEVIRQASPLVIDDTVGNPRSMERVQELLATIPADSLHIVYTVRGSRGTTINGHLAISLAKLVRANDAHLVVSASNDTADDRNRVTDAERDVTLAVLRDNGIRFDYEPTLGAAVRAALSGAGDGDVVLLLGAQGMDAGAALVRERLGDAD